MKKLTPAISMIIVFVILAIVSLVVLPDPMITQFSIGSSDVTTMPKLVGVLIPSLVGIVGSVLLLMKSDSKRNGYILTGVSIVILVIALFVNI